MQSLVIIMLSSLLSIAALGAWRMAEQVERLSFRLCRSVEQRFMLEAALSAEAIRVACDERMKERIATVGLVTAEVVMPMAVVFDERLRCRAVCLKQENGTVRIEVTLFDERGALMSAHCNV